MPSRLKKNLYILFSALLPFALLFVIVTLYEQKYLYAWFGTCVAVLLVEARVQAGGRVQHTSLFWTHLAFCIVFFITLSLAAFFIQTHILALACWVLFTGVIATGSILWLRGVQNATK